MYTVTVIIGTRPEAIKMSPVVTALKKVDSIRCRVCITGQHREMVDPILHAFGIVPDSALNVMERDQSLAGLTARAIIGVDQYLCTQRPDLVLVQGDTTTVLSATLASFYLHIPVGHLEAGLRTGTLAAPWPEEANRVLTARLATLHFAPTATAKSNLLAEGIPEASITVTGNTVVDALLQAADHVRRNTTEVDSSLACYPNLTNVIRGKNRIVLITGHRRENFGDGLHNICDAIRELASEFPDVHFVYPVHLNPNVRRIVERMLGDGSAGTPANVHLLEPLSYLPFVALMDRATLILTDSGGIQEEAPSLGKPVLVLRDATERPEAVAAGTARVVGTEAANIMRHVRQLLSDAAAYRMMAVSRNPFGDGQASRRIADTSVAFLDARTPTTQTTQSLSDMLPAR
jgi:UDP-N-acetylglucosamine 2-epimerase (non-hydrolysing)